MYVQKDETPASGIALAAKKGSPEATVVAEDAGRGLLALVQKAPVWPTQTTTEL